MWKPPELTVSGGFFLLVGWFAISCGWSLTLLVLSAAALHELGHLLLLCRYGAHIQRLRLSVFGAVMESSGSLSYAQELSAVLAGPGVNLLSAILFGILGRPTAAGAHAVLCAFNLLPIAPLDGGQALYLLLSWSTGPQTADWCCRWIGRGTAVSAVCCAVWLISETGGSLWLLPAICGLLTAALRQ